MCCVVENEEFDAGELFLIEFESFIRIFLLIIDFILRLGFLLFTINLNLLLCDIIFLSNVIYHKNHKI